MQKYLSVKVYCKIKAKHIFFVKTWIASKLKQQQQKKIKVNFKLKGILYDTKAKLKLGRQTESKK